MAAKDYESPTTPGLMVTFRVYMVERVCLNLRPDLGPRFWKDRKYWQPKFVRESVALSRLLRHFDENAPVVRRAVIEMVDERRMRTLMTRNQSGDMKRIRAKHRALVAQRETLAATATEPVGDLEGYVERNRSLSPTTQRNRLSRIEEVERRGETNQEQGNGQAGPRKL